jgi:hypothetical protein
MSFTPSLQRSRPGMKSSPSLAGRHTSLSSSTAHARHHGHPHARHRHGQHPLTHPTHHRREHLPPGIEDQAF